MRRILTVAAIVAVAAAFVDAAADAGEVPFPPVGRVALAALLLAAALLAAAGAWTVLLPGQRLRHLLPGFLLAQLARYVPGSVWQGVSQVLDVQRLGVGRGAATVAFAVQLATQLVAAVVVSVGVLLAGAPGPVRWVAYAAPAALVLLARPVLTAGLRVVGRLAPARLGHLAGTLPSQRRILAAAGLGTLSIVGVSGAYAVLLPGQLGVRGALAAVGVFAAAWVVGFLVVPLPAGVGVRELVLVVGLSATVGTAGVLAAAVLHRVIAIATEAALAGVVRLGPVVARLR